MYPIPSTVLYTYLSSPKPRHSLQNSSPLLTLTASGASCLLCEFHILQIVELHLLCLPCLLFILPLSLVRQCAKQMHKLNALMRANYTTKLKLDIKWQAWKLQAKWQMANDGEFKGQAKPESSPFSSQRSRSECNFYLLPWSCGAGGAGGLAQCRRELELHAQSTSHYALPLKISCATDCSHFCAGRATWQAN